MVRRRLMLWLPLLALVVTASRPAAPRAEEEAVLNAREPARLQRNVDAVLQPFADGALVVSASGRLWRGRDRLRGGVQEQVERGQREDAGPRSRQGATLSWPGQG